MKKIILLCAILGFTQITIAQNFTFECRCESYLSIANGDCDICNTTNLHSRKFTGLIVKFNGNPYKWIDAPYVVRVNDTLGIFDIWEMYGTDRIRIDMQQTPYDSIAQMKDSLSCGFCAQAQAFYEVVRLDTTDMPQRYYLSFDSTQTIDALVVDDTTFLHTSVTFTIAQQGATSGQVLKWNGSHWAPANDSTGTDPFYQLIRDNNVSQTQRNATNFYDTPRIGVSIVDDPGNNETEVYFDLLQNGANNGEVLKWDGFSWEPAPDGGGLWTDAGTYIYPTQFSDRAVIGANTEPNSSYNLQVVGDAYFSQGIRTEGEINAAGFAGTSLQFLKSAGTGLPPLWVTPANLTAATGEVTVTNGTNVLASPTGTNASIRLAQQGATTGQVLKWNGSTWSPGTDNSGGSYTFTNGLTESAGTVKLGGTLIDALTTINHNSNELRFYGGDMVIGRNAPYTPNTVIASDGLTGSTLSSLTLHIAAENGSKNAKLGFGAGDAGNVYSAGLGWFTNNIGDVIFRQSIVNTSTLATMRWAIGGETSDKMILTRDNTIGRLGVGFSSTIGLHSTLQSAGSFAVGVFSSTSNITVSENQAIVAKLTGSGTATWTLPSALGLDGRMYILHNRGTGTVTLTQTVYGNNGQTWNTLEGSRLAIIYSAGGQWNGVKVTSL